ncbi:MAG TPA: hypothetical protein VE998_01220 [Terriglobales bacterium]|nr:hypothetical protein [Terriglobales bacterium]
MKWRCLCLLFLTSVLAFACVAGQSSAPAASAKASKAVRTFDDDSLKQVSGRVSQNDLPVAAAAPAQGAPADAAAKAAAAKSTQPPAAPLSPAELKALADEQSSVSGTLANIDAQLARETDPGRREALTNMREHATKYMADVTQKLDAARQAGQPQPDPKAATDAAPGAPAPSKPNR